MDLGKYVAVGVLAVIVLAAVTYEPPREQRAAAGEAAPERVLEGSYGPEGADPDAPPSGPELEAPVSAPVGTPIGSLLGAPITGDLPAQTTAPAPTGAVATEPTSPLTPPTTPLAPAPLADPEPPQEYTVRAGQTLSDIARELFGDGGRWKELYAQNKDRIPDPNNIRQGMKLLYDGVARGATTSVAASAPATSGATTVATSAAGGRTYVVAKGDTLYSIAARELGKGTRWKEIADLNGIGPDGLVAGRTLRLPQ